MSRQYLSDKNILVISKPLARMLGIGESVVLRRIQYWLEFNEQYPKKSSVQHFHDGRWWAFNGYQGWTDDIEIYSKSAIKRILGTLETLGLILSTDQYNRRKADRTKWYTIDYNAYDRFVALWEKHGEPLYNVGKQSDEYKAFLDQWAVTGIPVTSTPTDRDEHTQESVTDIPTDRDDPSVTRESPKTPSEESAGCEAKAAPTPETDELQVPLIIPPHMLNFESANSHTSHPWVQAYAKLLGQPYTASRAEMNQVVEKQRHYDQAVFEEYAAIRLNEKPGCKMLFILQDLPNYIASKKAIKDVARKSPTRPEPQGIKTMSGVPEFLNPQRPSARRQ